MHDVAYGKTMRFRAIPLAALLAGLSPPADSVIETVALDGFAAQLPLDLVTNTDPANAVAWLAIEPCRRAMATASRQDGKRWAGLYFVDWGGGLDDPQRTMAVSGGEARKAAVARGALARARLYQQGQCDHWAVRRPGHQMKISPSAYQAFGRCKARNITVVEPLSQRGPTW
jgi:hypothetical protein